MIILAAVLLLFPVQSTSIQGTVVRSGGSDRLSKATVELRTIENNAAVLNSITTEEDGRFLFQNVRPGRYRLVVKRQGYVRPALTITVAAGRQMAGIQLPMTPTAAIYGRVHDNSGQPLGNIEVQALKASYPEGRRVLTPVQSVVTNDLGDYRLFWLAPGRYYVAAMHPQAQGMMRRMLSAGMSTTLGGANGVVFASNGNGDPAVFGGFEPEPESQTDRYAPIYFGGTADEQMASAIDLRAASDFGGVNIVVSPVRARHVRGVIVEEATRKPAQYPSLRRSESVDFMGGEQPEVNPDNGSFDILLLPGSHTLVANSANGSGSTTVRVGDADIENLTIVTSPLFNISGRMAVEGSSGDNADFSALRVSLRQDPPPPGEGPSSSSYSVPLLDGSFTLEATRGDFRVNVAPILNVTPSRFPLSLPPSLQNAYVKSIRLGNADVLNGGLQLDRAPSAQLEVVIGTTPGVLEGNAGKPDVSVVLAPNVRRRIELYRMTTTDSSGRFHFDRLPPGEYKMFAWEEVENGAWYDPDFMQTYENRGTAVRIVEGKTESVQLMVIPPL